jgi:hypothetical protein
MLPSRVQNGRFQYRIYQGKEKDLRILNDSTAKYQVRWPSRRPIYCDTMLPCWDHRNDRCDYSTSWSEHTHEIPAYRIEFFIS